MSEPNDFDGARPDDNWDEFDPDEDDGEDLEFDCPRFLTSEGWYCPAQGSEGCDWECPYS